MNLIINSKCFNNNKSIEKYKEMMKEINAKELYHVKIKKNMYRYTHDIEFNKDLKFSELMKIKDILYNEPIVAVHIKSGFKHTITLFDKTMER